MAKEELMQFEGLVIEPLPDARFRVQLDAGHASFRVCQSSGPSMARAFNFGV
jgi:translation initiation factor IF-1